MTHFQLAKDGPPLVSVAFDLSTATRFYIVYPLAVVTHAAARARLHEF